MCCFSRRSFYHRWGISPVSFPLSTRMVSIPGAHPITSQAAVSLCAIQPTERRVTHTRSARMCWGRGRTGRCTREPTGTTRSEAWLSRRFASRSNTDEGMPMNALREIGLLKQLEKFNHPNIVRSVSQEPVDLQRLFNVNFDAAYIFEKLRGKMNLGLKV